MEPFWAASKPGALPCAGSPAGQGQGCTQPGPLRQHLLLLGGLVVPQPLAGNIPHGFRKS